MPTYDPNNPKNPNKPTFEFYLELLDLLCPPAGGFMLKTDPAGTTNVAKPEIVPKDPNFCRNQGFDGEFDGFEVSCGCVCDALANLRELFLTNPYNSMYIGDLYLLSRFGNEYKSNPERQGFTYSDPNDHTKHEICIAPRPSYVDEVNKLLGTKNPDNIPPSEWMFRPGINGENFIIAENNKGQIYIRPYASNDGMITFAHELCGHWVPNLDHPEDETRYTARDPVIIIENLIRLEHDKCY